MLHISLHLKSCQTLSLMCIPSWYNKKVCINQYIDHYQIVVLWQVFFESHIRLLFVNEKDSDKKKDKYKSNAYTVVDLLLEISSDVFLCHCIKLIKVIIISKKLTMIQWPVSSLLSQSSLLNPLSLFRAHVIKCLTNRNRLTIVRFFRLPDHLIICKRNPPSIRIFIWIIIHRAIATGYNWSLAS